jgi:ParB-like chromosome segregation protein Spo0J
MKLPLKDAENVPLDEIVGNPWRDHALYPIDKDHVAELQQSINDHKFFGSMKGRRRNGKVEIGFGHHRLEAARKAKLATIPVVVEDMDDDQMLLLMSDENVTQAGNHPGAILNEVQAVIRRLIEGLLQTDDIREIPPTIVKAFESQRSLDIARGRLKKRLSDPDIDTRAAIGQNIIRRYLSQGDPNKARRAEEDIRNTISALKQSGRYDEIVDEAIRKQARAPATAKSAAIATTKQTVRRKPIFDARCITVFANTHQAEAFREAVTTDAGRKTIPVDQQHALAEAIVCKPHSSAPYVKMMVHAEIERGLKQQRKINKEERDLYHHEQREALIDNKLRTANTSLRALVSALAELDQLAKQFPCHPKIGGFSARLDLLVNVIKQLSRTLASPM